MVSKVSKESKEQFSFPEQFAWPCFFTMQVNSDARDKQLKLWQDLVCGYSKSKRMYTWDLNAMYASELCMNPTINRRLSRKDFDILVEHLLKFGKARKRD